MIKDSSMVRFLELTKKKISRENASIPYLTQFSFSIFILP